LFLLSVPKSPQKFFELLQTLLTQLFVQGRRRQQGGVGEYFNVNGRTSALDLKFTFNLEKVLAHVEPTEDWTLEALVPSILKEFI
jgi:hypothetical protein